MHIAVTIFGIVVLVFLIAYFRVHAFLAFLFVSLVIGLVLGMSPERLLQSVQNGIGSTLGSIAGIIALGAMLGKLIGVSGAAQQVSATMIKWFGTRHIRWAFMLTAFVIGLPLFYSVAFMLLVPIAMTAAVRYKLSAVYISLPLLASLSVTQGYLPPHPAPLYLVKQLHANMGSTLLYGCIISIPAILIVGAWYGSTIKKYATQPNLSFVAEPIPDERLPAFHRCLVILLLPILLIALGAVATNFPERSFTRNLFVFLGDANVSLLITVVAAVFVLQINRRYSKTMISEFFGVAIKDIASILLIFGGAGALKQVLADAGIADAVAAALSASNMNVYVLGWGIAAVIRVCVGSSTVAGITTAGFIIPLMQHSHADPNLMVLGIGAGSMMFSHVNDTGFWLFREYFLLSMKDTIRTWSVMDTLVSITGLLGVLALSWWLH